MTQLAKAKQILIEAGADLSASTDLQSFLQNTQLTLSSDANSITITQPNGKSLNIPAATAVSAGILSSSDFTKLTELPTGSSITSSLATKVDKVAGKSLLLDSIIVDLEQIGPITPALDNKVDKETGKGLIDPAPVDGKIYGRYNGGWSQVTGGGGSDINVVQTTGTSTEDVMSQKAVTDALASAGGATKKDFIVTSYDEDTGVYTFDGGTLDPREFPASVAETEFYGSLAGARHVFNFFVKNNSAGFNEPYVGSSDNTALTFEHGTFYTSKPMAPMVDDQGSLYITVQTVYGTKDPDVIASNVPLFERILVSYDKVVYYPTEWAEVNTGGGVPEAPVDGKQYARKDADWTEVDGGGDNFIDLTDVFPIGQGVFTTGLDILKYVKFTLGLSFGTFFLKAGLSAVASWDEATPVDPVTYPAVVRVESSMLAQEGGGSLFEFSQMEGYFSSLGVSGPEYGYAIGTIQGDPTGLTDFSLSNSQVSGNISSWGKVANSSLWIMTYSENYGYRPMKGVMIDTNGFIKESSPIIQLYTNSIAINGSTEISEAALLKTSTGVYELSNVPLLSRDGWYIETPKDRNGKPYFMLDYEEYPAESKLVIKTYSVAYDNGEAINGAPVDILEDRFVSLRFAEDPKEEEEPVV